MCRRARETPRSSRCGDARAARSASVPSNGKPRRVREQVANGRARRPGRLVEVDDALLGGDERRERGDRLRDRSESNRACRVAVRRDLARPDRRHRRPRTRRASRRSGEVPARAAILVTAWSGATSPGRARTSRSSATRAPSSSGDRCTCPAPRRTRPTARRRRRTSTTRRASASS